MSSKSELVLPVLYVWIAQVQILGTQFWYDGGALGLGVDYTVDSGLSIKYHILLFVYAANLRTAIFSRKWIKPDSHLIFFVSIEVSFSPLFYLCFGREWEQNVVPVLVQVVLGTREREFGVHEIRLWPRGHYGGPRQRAWRACPSLLKTYKM